MTITTNLIRSEIVETIWDKQVTVDDRTADIGGSFHLSPFLQPYSPLPLKWAYDRLIVYPDATLIDVGACSGCFTLLSAHHPNLFVHAFEPVPLSRRILEENVYLNNLTNKVKISDRGVASYDGLGVLHAIREPGGVGVSMVDGSPAWHKNVQDMKIQVCSLDKYCEDHAVKPTMIKIDVEGGELNVLRGAYNIIDAYHPFLIIEYSAENAKQYGHGAWELIRFIERLGYVWTCPELDLLCVHKNWNEIK